MRHFKFVLSPKHVISAGCGLCLSEEIQNKQLQESNGGLKWAAVYEFQFANAS